MIDAFFRILMDTAIKGNLGSRHFSLIQLKSLQCSFLFCVLYGNHRVPKRTWPTGMKLLHVLGALLYREKTYGYKKYGVKSP